MLVGGKVGGLGQEDLWVQELCFGHVKVQPPSFASHHFSVPCKVEEGDVWMGLVGQTESEQF